jgi:FkbM family methyltransferase
MLPGTMTVPILQGPLKGKKWIVGSQRHAFWLGSYEPDMQRLVAKLVNAGSVFYDVGANVGFYSLLASGLVDTGKVFAFEPLPRNIYYLQRHMALNHVDNVEVLEMAVCDRIGTSCFDSEDTRAMGRLKASGNIQVQTTTLDALLQQQKIAPPAYIKMDIEGAEFHALQGGERCLRDFRPVLFLATHGRQVHQDCCELLRSWNFDITVIATGAADRAEILASPSKSKLTDQKAPLT